VLAPRPRCDREPDCAGGQGQSKDEKDGYKAPGREAEGYGWK
jgi:hypothetical protein